MRSASASERDASLFANGGPAFTPVMVILVSALLVCLLVAVLLFWSWPGQPRPFVDDRGRPLPGSVCEKIRLPINGAPQGMIIKSRDSTNPVLLYLHGGMPDYFLAERYHAELEECFTVCWWEQRGSGLSYTSRTRPKTVTLDQLIADTLEVTDYLRRRFDRERIYLMGHSGGTFLGMLVAARAPDRYRAFIGVAQVSRQLESEKLAYDYMLGQFRAQGNTRMTRKLEAAPVTATEVPRAYLAARDEAMHLLGVGTTRDMKSVPTGIFLPSLRAHDYTLGEKINLWRGKVSSGVSTIWSDMIATDLSTRVPEVAVPVYFLHGIHDYTCSYTEAKAYFDILKAPIKGFYTFTQSAHSPIFEEPARARKILREDVLAGTNRLADRT